MRLASPPTVTLVRALIVDQSGLWVTLACTDARDYGRIADAASDTARPLLLSTLDLVADALVARITGWKRWEAEYVWRNTVGAWSAIDGDLRASGTDLLALPAHAATNTAYAWFRRNVGRDDKEWKKFLRGMEHEPRRVLEAIADQGMAVDAFDQMQAMAGGGRSDGGDA